MNQNPISQQQYMTGTPLSYYNSGSTVATNNGQQGTVSVSTPNTQPQIYNYPTTSLYDPNSKQPASGVNIYIYNPSAIGGPSSNSVANATYAMPNATNPNSQAAQPVPVAQPAPSGAQAIAPQQTVSVANSPLYDGTQNQRTKQVVELTDEYIKGLEEKLKNQNKDVRKSGIVDLIKRFEEDDSRFDDPALNALLNIALQDPKLDNSLLVLSLLNAEKARGNQDTKVILQKLSETIQQKMQDPDLTSIDKKILSQDLVSVEDAKQKVLQTKVEIIDKNPPKSKSDEE